LAIAALLFAIFAPIGSAWSPSCQLAYGALTGLNSYCRYDLSNGSMVGWAGQNVPGLNQPHGVYVNLVGNLVVGTATGSIQVFETKCCTLPTTPTRVVTTTKKICGMRMDYGGISAKSIWVCDMGGGGATNVNPVSGVIGPTIGSGSQTSTCGIGFHREGSEWFAYLSNMSPAYVEKIRMSDGSVVATTGPLDGHIFHQLSEKQWGSQAGIYVTCGSCADGVNGGTLHHYDWNLNLVRYIQFEANPVGPGGNEPHGVEIIGDHAYTHIRPGDGAYGSPGTVAETDLLSGAEVNWGRGAGGRIVDPVVAGFGDNGNIGGIAQAPPYDAYCPNQQPPCCIPEVPFSILLPLSSAFMFGGYLLVRHRRSSR